MCLSFGDFQKEKKEKPTESTFFFQFSFDLEKNKIK
jgi:hypothetical protein